MGRPLSRRYGLAMASQSHRDTWNPSQIAVSEFGFAEPFEELKQLLGDIRFDLARTTYYHDYMEAILIAMSEGVNVVGTLAWSIYDNLEVSIYRRSGLLIQSD
jgi:beta-glucosidase/6-phospho-beta-glucosidase/beta-galactosidase